MKPTHPFSVVLLGVMFLIAHSKPLRAADAVGETNVMVEIALTAQLQYADPFNDVTLDVTFTDPRGGTCRVPAFWDGKNLWKARYASPIAGAHRWRSECSKTDDKGLHDVTGEIEIKPYTGDNPLYVHGPVRVAPDDRHFEYADGTPFFWLGDTWWMGLCHRLRFPEDVKTLAADRKAKGFNVIQIVAGLYPDMHPFDPRGANEAGFPWEKDYARINPAYFDKADERLLYLVEHGFSPCIVGAWGYFMPWMGVEKMQQHWRNLIARYSALPVIWCAAGEANLNWYLDKPFPIDDRKQVAGWTQVMRYIRETDPFRRPLTIHPTGLNRLSARHCTDDVALLDFDMLQTPHGQREAVPPTVFNVRASYEDTPVMPVINGEAAYEMLSDSLPTQWTRRMFWLCMMNGAAGHTYGANGIWQVNRPGQPHGPSPHHAPDSAGYGTIPWQEAMNLPGSTQVALGKKLFERFDWQKFTPHPEWATFADDAPLKLEGAHWIWFNEGKPAENAPAEKRYFRRAFEIPEGKPIKSARLRVSADDRFAAFVNGEPIGASGDGPETWRTGRQFNDVAKLLHAGSNVLAIEAENRPAPAANPAALIAHLLIQFDDSTEVSIRTDAEWKSAKEAPAGWEKSDLDDAKWVRALSLGAYGASPWGAIDAQRSDGYFGPQSTGIPGVVRLTYVPEAQPVTLRLLERGRQYEVEMFDPVTGKTTALNPVTTGDDGNAIVAAPAGIDHDWVLILTPGKARPAQGATGATLGNEQIAWHLDWSDGTLRSAQFENRISGHRFSLSNSPVIELVFSANPAQVAQPFRRVSDFTVKRARIDGAEHAELELRSDQVDIDVTLHFTLDGATRRKWIDVTNSSDRDVLLLDVALDDFATDGRATGGGEGQPIFLEDEAFASIEHPAGVNTASGGRVQLMQYPGIRLAAGATYHSPAALVSAAPRGQARQHFIDYLQQRSRRPKKAISIYTPFGINNLWGGCPTLNDEETLDVLNVLERWQKRGARFDYFTLDTGWVDPSSDLTRFRPHCFPEGPGAIVKRVEELGMKFGLWFATSWGAQSAWDHPAAFAGGQSPGLAWREGYPITREGIQFCIGEERYHQLLKNAVLYHNRENHVRLFKFDGGDYVCNDASHGHLTGKYSVAPRFDNLIDIADALRKVDPDVFIMWYWGLRSPFWALHGDMLFESGLMMEGSATSAYPALHYRDSVSLAQDQNAQFARNVPPIVKDSLGVWIADDRWGNYMFKERWREGMVMDLARGNLFAPNLWGDIYQFNDDDVDFLSRIAHLAKTHENLLLHRRAILGDPWHNDVYGYSYGDGARALLFATNMHFAARPARLRLDESIGLDAPVGTRLSIVSHFPDETRLARDNDDTYRIGDALEIWLRPFETLALEVSPLDRRLERLPVRDVSRESATRAGVALKLAPTSLPPNLDIRFADAANFESQGLAKKSYAFETTLPALDEDRTSILAIIVRLRKGIDEWRYKMPVVRIAQAVLRVDGEMIQLHPVPDGRQYGNTQGIEGCSWVTYKVRLGSRYAGKRAQIAVHAYVPVEVEAMTEGWVVDRWWNEDPRPNPNGYYTDEPS